MGILGLAWPGALSQAQTIGPGAGPGNSGRQISPAVVVERGPHHRTWQRVEAVPGPGGRMVEQRRRYQEIASGLHFQNERGEWEESREEIELLPNRTGAVARKGRHKVIFPPELKEGLIELQSAEGTWLRSRVWGLAYYDTATGESVLLGETQESAGRLVGENVVTYADAFTDLRADVRYTYTRAKFEQDVVLREEPPEPEQFGLSSRTTRLQVLTEFVEAPQPAKVRKQIDGMTDETLDFGAFSLGAGKAFEAAHPRLFERHVPVAKEWGVIEGRTFLVESASYEKLAEAARKLPAGRSKGARLERRGKGAGALLALRNFLPPAYAGNSTAPATSHPRMAKAETSAEAGLVMDFVTLNGALTNHIFQGDLTYYISGPTLLRSNTVVEGGTVIKFNSNGAGYLELTDGTMDCRTAAYRPAVFTSQDDNSAGETVAGSTGSPGVINSVYIVGLWPAPVLELKHLRLAYASYGIYLWGAALDLEDAQILHSDYPIYCLESAVAARNVLFSGVSASAFYLDAATLQVAHATVSQCARLVEGPFLSAGFTNSLFAGVGSFGGPFASVSNGTNAGGSGVFQAVGGGAHYLAAGSAYRNAGTTELDAALLASLRRKTTYPPIACTNVTFNVPTTLGPQAQRDTDLPDLGYHYDPLDYALGGCTAVSNLTFTAGTAVGWFRTTSGWYHAGQAIRMVGNIVVSFAGTVTDPAYFVRLNTVQENDRTAGYGHGGIENWEAPSVPAVRGRFLRCATLANELFNGYFADDYGVIRAEMTHSEFWGGSLQTYGDYMRYTNCLMWRPWFVGVVLGGAASDFVMRNCTLIGGRLEMQRTGPTPVLVRDCAFDGTIISLGDSYGGNATYTQCDYNAYTNATNPFPLGGAHDVAGAAFDWRAGAWGSFYQPWGSGLTDQGSVAADMVGLYHFTIFPDGYYYKEGASRVDLGYHYAEADMYGRPLDTDGDLTPDYLEDYNGNGAVDAGETDWQSTADPGLAVRIARPGRGSVNP